MTTEVAFTGVTSGTALLDAIETRIKERYPAVDPFANSYIADRVVNTTVRLMKIAHEDNDVPKSFDMFKHLIECAITLVMINVNPDKFNIY